MKWLPEILGTVGYCLLVAGLYVQFGAGVALMVGGGLLLAGAIKMVRK
ncbi:hypothetical protein LOY46_03610 [Pseudomonas sichuanensis]|nr:hypothetical protein [Pseudomonas sichuanensis]UVK83810.1 hypothetical protein LOY46_03610 [Pseudomonas sichuanensis]